VSTAQRVRPFQFRAASDGGWEDKLFDHIHQQGVEDLVIALSGVVHRPVQVTYEADYQRRSGDGLVAPVSVIIKLTPGGRVCLDLDRQLAACMVDMMVGGSGEREDGPFTDLEAVLVRRVLAVFPRTVVQWWDEVAEISASVEEIVVSNVPGYTRKEDGTEVGYRLSYGKAVGYLRVFYEDDAKKHLLRAAASEGLTRQDRPATGDSIDLVRRVNELDLVVSARLGLLNLTMRQLMELDTGDVLDTGTGVDQGVSVLVEGQPKFLAMPGRRGGQVAVRVTGLLKGVSEGA